MKMDKKTYQKFADAHAPRSPLGKNCFHAFLVGGLICTVGQGLRELYQRGLDMNETDAGTLTSVTLILAAVILTGLGVVDNIAKVAGGGYACPDHRLCQFGRFPCDRQSC